MEYKNNEFELSEDHTELFNQADTIVKRKVGEIFPKLIMKLSLSVLRIVTSTGCLRKTSLAVTQLILSILTNLDITNIPRVSGRN